jgi:hypothetical protein
MLQLGILGHRCTRSKLTPNDLDASMLMWDIHRTMNVDYFGPDRRTLHSQFSDFKARFRRWWLAISDVLDRFGERPAQ